MAEFSTWVYCKWYDFDGWISRCYRKYKHQCDNAKNLRNYAAGMIENHPQYNLLFSIQMYCEWVKVWDVIAGSLQWTRDNNIPFIVGEFGYQHATDGSCDIDEKFILDECQDKGIGWHAWSLKGNSGGVEYLDLFSDWACSSLSDWRKTVFNGRNGTKTSVICSVFEGGAAVKTVVEITAPTDNSEFSTTETISFSANAFAINAIVVDIKFYEGTNLFLQMMQLHIRTTGLKWPKVPIL